jgi:glycosyltransferase involved in cell wall biosynthesis
MAKNRFRILQIFNRYLQYGGEEGSVLRIGDAMQEISDVGYFLGASSDILYGGIWQKVMAPVYALHNFKTIHDLKRYQFAANYHLWLIHNTFPFLSPSVYELAYKLQIPIVQYLHNYRMSCVNGYFLNHGKTCTSCIDGNFTTAALTGCWRDSRIVSGYAGLVLSRMRNLGVFEKNSAWIALSSKQKELHVRMGIPEEKIHIIPHFFVPNPANKLSANGKDVLYVGRLSREKGVHELLDAWKLVTASDSSLVLMGNGPEERPLAERIRSEKIRNVEFLGFISKEAQGAVWARSAFSVVPSIWEDPLPTVIFEAWEHGRPVIATNVGGNRETINDGVNGLKVEMSNPVQLAQAIDALLGDRALCNQMAEAGMEDIRTKYSRNQWLAKMQLVYNLCL